MSTLHYLVAFSGGLDSTVLLHLLKQALQEEPHTTLSAIHIHHGLQHSADEWARHCQTLCDQWQIPLTLVAINAQAKPGESPEAAARDARYHAIANHMTERTVLVTGHHQDDQVETLLLQLLRGAGAKGLSAMPTWKTMAKGWHYRPLLTYTRQQLIELANTQQLTWIEDPSNNDHRFTRNIVRHEVLPLLAQHWPGYRKTLSRSARLLAENDALLRQFAQEQLQQLGANHLQLPLTHFRHLSIDRQALLLRTWLAQNQKPMPNEAKLKQFLSDLGRARQGRHPQLDWAHLRLYRHQQTLYCQQQPRLDHVDTTLSWQNFPATVDTKRWTLKAISSQNGLRTLSAQEINALSIRYWQSGGRFHPANRHHSQTIKKLWQEWHIPMECRRHIPLLYCGDTLIAIADLAVAKDWHTTNQAWQLSYLVKTS